tara:strand:- start:330 stop:1280 length:951 start_codon:yes stop_codon:yes gene_type:complete
MKAGISGRIELKKQRNKLYTEIDGVYTPLVYEQQDSDGQYYYREVFVTDPNRLAKQKSLLNKSVRTSSVKDFDVVTTTTPQEGTKTKITEKTVKNTLYLTYKQNVISNDSDGQSSGTRVSQWTSIQGSSFFRQGTTSSQPYLGGISGGVAGQSPLYFDHTATHLEANSNITLSNNFSIFISFSIEKDKYVRLLGNSSDANVFISFNENANLNFHFGLGSGLTYELSHSTEILRDTPYVLSLVRSGSTLTVRLNKTSLGSLTVSTNDLVINTLGRAKDTNFFFGGHISAVQFWDEALSVKLEEFEDILLNENTNLLY